MVIGGESGPSIDRPIIEMDLDWVRDVIDQVQPQGGGVVKQMGSRWATRHAGKTACTAGADRRQPWRDTGLWPEELRMRESRRCPWARQAMTPNVGSCPWPARNGVPLALAIR